MTAGFRLLRVAARRQETDDSVVVTFDRGPHADLTFRPGQYLTLRREFDGEELRRSYSLCSPAPDGALRVGIKRVDGGVFSTWANQELAVGDLVEVMAPGGRFTHDIVAASQRRYCLIAAGSGITPVYSIAATILAGEPAATVTLLQIDQRSSSVMLLEEVEALRNRYLDRFGLWRILTREASPSPLLSERPDQARLGELIDRGLLPGVEAGGFVDHVFVCGPEELVINVRSVYEERGVAAEAIHDELFTTAQSGRARRAAPLVGREKATPVAEGRALLHGRETTFVIYDGDSILEAVQRQRPDVPFSCRAGVCSTCRARLTKGEASMDVSHGLVPGEAEAGYVLTCQAHPLGPLVAVDFDG